MKKLEKIMEITVWLPRSVLQDKMPEFCKERPWQENVQRPEKLIQRAQTYSPYKESNTMKFLTVIAPNGLLLFQMHTVGKHPDKFTTRRCGVEEYLCPGDTIMADRGLKLNPHLEAQGISMKVPAFTKGGLLHDLYATLE